VSVVSVLRTFFSYMCCLLYSTVVFSMSFVLFVKWLRFLLYVLDQMCILISCYVNHLL